MIITYLRSSSFNTHSFCEQQYFFEYVLGYKSPSNQKADKGTIVHKVMEILACISLGLQNKKTNIEDDIVGNINLHDYDLDYIINSVYNYYANRFTHHTWKTIDLKHCKDWINKALTYNNGLLDPRNQKIIQPEQHFDIQIKKPWAKYNYDGIEGYLGIKGTIDLIVEPNPGTLEIVDYKTGKRLDWATGQEKTFAKLQNDPQLRLYHYAASILYPNIDHFMVSIYYINDGGIFTMCYDKSDLSETENMIRKKFEEIKRCKRPKLNKSWKCTKLCHFGKNSFANNPLIEYRDDQLCSKDTPMTMCEQIKHDIDLKGISSVVDEYTVKGYNVGKYKAPGSIE